MNPHLKPCPFCGNESPRATHDDYIHENGQPMPVVECTNCHTWVRAESWNSRAALAPAAVVMPERKQWDATAGTAENMKSAAWNSALDEVTRLNRRAIPEGLLERIDRALEHARMFIQNGVALGFIRMPDNDTPDPAKDTLPTVEAAQNELRALLGEEDA